MGAPPKNYTVRIASIEFAEKMLNHSTRLLMMDDNIIFDACLILNITIWPKLDKNTDDVVLEKQKIIGRKHLLQ